MRPHLSRPGSSKHGSRPGSRLSLRCQSRGSRLGYYENRSNNAAPDSMLSTNMSSMARANRSSELTALSSNIISAAEVQNVDNKKLLNSSTTFLAGKDAFVPSDVFVCLPKENVYVLVVMYLNLVFEFQTKYVGKKRLLPYPSSRQTAGV